MSHARSFLSAKPRRRATAKLTTILDSRLHSYTLAAKGTICNWNGRATASALSLAGVALLAAPALEAEIVYTPADIHVYRSRTGVTTVSLDINNDGQPDFKFEALFGASFSSGNDIIYRMMWVDGNIPSNQAMSTNGGAKAALRAGARIGPEGKFGPNELMASCDDFNGRVVSGGQWINVQNRYLGVKFQIDGEAHYGWVRITEDCNDATITGYAYETDANRPLRAGVLPFANQSNADPAATRPSTPQPVSLGVLAAGALGLPKWRSQ